MIFQRGRYTTNQPVQFSVWLFWDHSGLKSQLTFSKAKPRMANPFAASKQRSSCGQWAAKRWFRTLSLPQERVISLEPYGFVQNFRGTPPSIDVRFLVFPLLKSHLQIAIEMWGFWVNIAGAMRGWRFGCVKVSYVVFFFHLEKSTHGTGKTWHTFLGNT